MSRIRFVARRTLAVFLALVFALAPLGGLAQTPPGMLRTGSNATSAAFGALVTAAGSAATITLGSTALTYGTPVTTVTGLTLSGGTLSGNTTLPGSGQISSAGNLGLGALADVTARLLVSRNTAALPGFPSGTVAAFGNADGTATRLLIDAFAEQGHLSFRRANNTAVSPSAVSSGQTIGSLTYFGYGATGYSDDARAAVIVNTTENWTDSAQGTKISLRTTPNGTTTLTERLRIEGEGVSLGEDIGSTNAPQAMLHVGRTSGTARVYNSLTNASNGEWGEFSWSSNVLNIGTNKNGTGQTRNLKINIGGAVKLDYGVTNAFLWTIQNQLRSVGGGSGTNLNSAGGNIALQNIDTTAGNWQRLQALDSGGDAMAQIGVQNIDHVNNIAGFAIGVRTSAEANPGTKLDFNVTNTGLWTFNAAHVPKSGTYANRPGSPATGTIYNVTDSNTAIWGATIAGGGANNVLGRYNGTNWTVMGM